MAKEYTFTVRKCMLLSCQGLLYVIWTRSFASVHDIHVQYIHIHLIASYKCFEKKKKRRRERKRTGFPSVVFKIFLLNRLKL